ncbi:MAG: BMP family ABC transporter substrate-binding protein [Anaerolineaceae bacterium]|nr:BMP family ABC transporter substrate-binding protein [Anaerolineaceae bacterium]MCY3906747.1 BMP family ABC transporter substrate-binding protein [Anaerolineaceae bacterium]MDD9956323.1 BMP family ABC transporter substrate-binding protein [Anaerolineaceae bacterium]MDE0329764.1 BMP family ABC transporter substrate-binding protein [Anaerolineaceae bacterium]MDE0609861.1 BMP family ABC transporter substrate-binding protein [Anaerolineaceae bacterium]
MFRKIAFALMVCTLFGMLALPAIAQDEIIYGVVLVGPRNDRGWSQSHFEAGQYVEANNENATMLFFESLNEADTPEATLMDVVTEMVDSGAEVIFTTSASFEQDTNGVAEAFPEVVFINITGSNVLHGDAPFNVGNFNTLMEVPRLLAGCSAALASETGKIGYLGALIDPETRRLAASSYLGARHCWNTYRADMGMDLEFTVTWIGFWFHIPGFTLDPTEVANEFFDNGADVVISGIDTTEAIQVAGRRASEGSRTFAIPYGNAGGCDEAPEACLGVAYYNWGPAYLDVVNSAQDGSWEQSWDWLALDWMDINNPDTSTAGYLRGTGMPEEIAANLDEFQGALADYMSAQDMGVESIYLWEGPLNLQDGTELAAEGEAVPLLDIWFSPQLLEGMIGASE